jgi:Arm DNA-binding domain
MLTDTALKHLKSRDKAYKVADRDGMYAVVKPSGAIVFRYDYRLNGRRETLTIGRYGDDGISLARAREKCLEARRLVAEGQSPSREKRRIKEARNFAEFGERWFNEAPMADSTRAMRRSIFDRDIVPAWKNRLLIEILPDDLRALCAKVKDRGRACNRRPRPRHRQTDLWLRDHARREGEESGRRGRARIDRNLRAQGPGAVADRNPDHAAATRTRADIADHSPRPPTHPPHDGTQERTARRRVGRGQFRGCCLDDPPRSG